MDTKIRLKRSEKPQIRRRNKNNLENEMNVPDWLLENLPIPACKRKNTGEITRAINKIYDQQNLANQQQMIIMESIFY